MQSPEVISSVFFPRKGPSAPTPTFAIVTAPASQRTALLDRLRGVAALHFLHDFKNLIAIFSARPERASERMIASMHAIDALLRASPSVQLNPTTASVAASLHTQLLPLIAKRSTLQCEPASAPATISEDFGVVELFFAAIALLAHDQLPQPLKLTLAAEAASLQLHVDCAEGAAPSVLLVRERICELVAALNAFNGTSACVFNAHSTHQWSIALQCRPAAIKAEEPSATKPAKVILFLGDPLPTAMADAVQSAHFELAPVPSLNTLCKTLRRLPPSQRNVLLHATANRPLPATAETALEPLQPLNCLVCHPESFAINGLDSLLAIPYEIKALQRFTSQIHDFFSQ